MNRILKIFLKFLLNPRFLIETYIITSKKTNIDDKKYFILDYGFYQKKVDASEYKRLVLKGLLPLCPTGMRVRPIEKNNCYPKHIFNSDRCGSRNCEESKK